MDFAGFILGRPLATEEEKAERIGPAAGIPIFGLDALSSAVYGPEAALTLLIPLGMAGIHYLLPISISIVILLTIVYFSYCQTIQAYPYGGGSYTVASENLGTGAGLLAAASLMIDYVLTAAVGISAGVGALVSAVPSLQAHTLSMCLAILLLLVLVNLRGVRETGGIFMIPTYLFIGCLLVMIATGLVKALLAGGHPLPVVAPPKLKAVTESAGAWFLLRAFSSGCTAMTGVEAVSNGVMAFKDPTDQYARRTLTIIIAILMVMLLGIAYLAPAYGVAATAPGEPGYQSVLSQLLAAIAGTGMFYWVSIVSILLVLALSANTAFADFPRLARAIAGQGFLPHALTIRGRRLVFSQGVYALGILAAILLTIFGGVTDRLIPLYAVGAFMAFTLSQAGMVVHWKRMGGPAWQRNMAINGLGALATAITTAVVLITKFTEGAWITVILIPALILSMRWVKAHYDSVERQTHKETPANAAHLSPPIVVVPMDRWSLISEKALRYAWSLSPDVRVLHIQCGAEIDPLCREYAGFVEAPARAAGVAIPELVVLKSPYRFVIRPIVDYALNLQKANGDRYVTVLIPELVESRWYYFLLHDNRAAALKALLLFGANRRITVTSVPWYVAG